jgi:hypothetical protein
MSYPLGKASGGQRADSKPTDVDGRRGELSPGPARFRATHRTQLCHVGSCCRQDNPDRDSVDQSRHEQRSEALRREEHERAEDREANRCEQEPPAPVPIGDMTCEQQCANDTDRVHRVDDSHREQREVITGAVQTIKRARHGRERHHGQKRERHQPEGPPVAPATSYTRRHAQ